MNSGLIFWHGSDDIVCLSFQGNCCAAVEKNQGNGQTNIVIPDLTGTNNKII